MLRLRSAAAIAKPELEIFADDVKCAHGATVGELDATALFYLESRGIAPAEAKKLLLRAFVGSVFDGIAEEAERARVEAAAMAALERVLCTWRSIPGRSTCSPTSRGSRRGGTISTVRWRRKSRAW